MVRSSTPHTSIWPSMLTRSWAWHLKRKFSGRNGRFKCCKPQYPNLLQRYRWLHHIPRAINQASPQSYEVFPFVRLCKSKRSFSAIPNSHLCFLLVAVDAQTKDSLANPIGSAMDSHHQHENPWIPMTETTLSGCRVLQENTKSASSQAQVSAEENNSTSSGGFVIVDIAQQSTLDSER